MIYQLLIAGLMSTNFIIIEDNQMEYNWIESCYGIECIGYSPEPEYQEDGIAYWNYQFYI